MGSSNSIADLAHPVGLLVLARHPNVQQPEEREYEPEILEDTDEHFVVKELLVQVKNVEQHHGDEDDEEQDQAEGIGDSHHHVEHPRDQQGHQQGVEFIHLLHQHHGPTVVLGDHLRPDHFLLEILRALGLGGLRVILVLVATQIHLARDHANACHDGHQEYSEEPNKDCASLYVRELR